MKDHVKARWGLLRAALLEGKVSKGSSSSFRNHLGFNLFVKKAKDVGHVDTGNNEH